MDQSEQRLIRQAQQGNHTAFEMLVALHDRQVLKLSCSLLGSQEDAKDVYQDIFLQVFRKLHSFRFESEFSTWLYRIVVNHCLNYRRHRQRRKHYSLETPLHESGATWAETLEDGQNDPEHHVINRELGQAISAAIQTLSERQRAVFVLRHFHGHKLLQIAEILDCSEGTVKNYLFRATRHLQKKLRDYVEDAT